MFEVWSGNLSGRFVATGQDTFLPFPTGVDFIHVRNQTVSYAAGAARGAEFFWQKGDANGRGTIYTKTVLGVNPINALGVSQIADNGGFYLIDNSINTPGASTAITGITANGGGGAAPGSPRVLTGNTRGLPVPAVVGPNNPAGIVRIFNTVGAVQLGGIDFSVANVVNDTSFDLIYMVPIAGANPGAGTYRVIPYVPYIYPSNRYITSIVADPNNAAQAIVTLSVTHEWQPGQKVQFIIPAVDATRYGMTELDGVQATIVDINVPAALNGVTNTITVDVDVSGFTAFAFPVTAGPGFTPAQVIPFGENTGVANTLLINPFADSVRNIAQIGLLLRAGVNSPAGIKGADVPGDVITWVAGKSWNQ